jgi:outer membrane lipoprotein-sorting protein
MIRRLAVLSPFVWLMVAMSASFSVAAPANPTVDAKAKELLTRMADAYRELETCSQHVELRTESGLQTDIVTGTVSFKRPNDAAVETKSAHGTTTAIADGKFIYVELSQEPGEYLKVPVPSDTGTIFRTIEAGGAAGNGLLPFVVSGYDPYAVVSRNLKSMTLLAPDVIGGVPVDVVQVVTESSGHGDATMTIAMGRSDHLLRRVGILAENGGVAIIETLSDVKVNPSLPERTFHFIPAPGAKQLTTTEPPAK